MIRFQDTGNFQTTFISFLKMWISSHRKQLMATRATCPGGHQLCSIGCNYWLVSKPESIPLEIISTRFFTSFLRRYSSILISLFLNRMSMPCTVYPKKYTHGFCFAVLCCGYTLTDFPISIRLTSLALWQSNDCPSATKATPMNMDEYFMWIHYERLHNHNKAKHNKTVLGIYCIKSPRRFLIIDLPLIPR